MDDKLAIIKDLCYLFCCPPKLSHIVAKLSFVPPLPTYNVIKCENSDEYRLTLKESTYSTDKIKVYFTETSRKSRIVIAYLKKYSNKRAKHTILYSHGNAVDVGELIVFMNSFVEKYETDVVVYDYSGYGASSGQTLEANLYTDSEAVIDHMINSLNIPVGEIILYGQSIGTVPTVKLATKNKVAAVILHSPLTSGLKVVCPDTKISLCCDPFSNISRVDKIKSYTLIIHGTDDKMIGVNHGHALYDKLKYKLQPSWIYGAGHNDIEGYNEYFDRLDKFFDSDLDRIERGEEPIFDEDKTITNQPVWRKENEDSFVKENDS